MTRQAGRSFWGLYCDLRIAGDQSTVIAARRPKAAGSRRRRPRISLRAACGAARRRGHSSGHAKVTPRRRAVSGLPHRCVGEPERGSRQSQNRTFQCAALALPYQGQSAEGVKPPSSCCGTYNFY